MLLQDGQKVGLVIFCSLNSKMPLAFFFLTESAGLESNQNPWEDQKTGRLSFCTEHDLNQIVCTHLGAIVVMWSLCLKSLMDFSST